MLALQFSDDRVYFYYTSHSAIWLVALIIWTMVDRSMSTLCS